MRFLAKLTGGLFFGLWVSAGLVLFFYYWEILTAWLGGILGTFVALFMAPGVFVFPLIYWFVQGTFPTFYFELLGVCAGSALVGSLLWSVGSVSSE